MFLKTTSIRCAMYSETLTSFPFLGKKAPAASRIRLKKKKVSEMRISEFPVYLQTYQGIIGVLFTDDLSKKPELFVLHKTAQIRPGVYFNIVSLSESSVLTYQQASDSPLKSVSIPPYSVDVIQSDFEVDEIYAYYYSTKGNNYLFDGEKHPYYELTYVDNGELECKVDDQEFHLPTKSLMFYCPNQFHTQSTQPDKTCAYLTIMFSMNDLDPKLIGNRVIPCTQDIYSILSVFMHRSNENWKYKNDMLIGLMKCLVVNAINSDEQTEIAHNPMQQHYENELLNEIINYINSNYQQLLTINDICQKFAISRSSLQMIFKKHVNLPPKHFINNAKLEYGKIMLKNSAYTVSQISDTLGYSSIHYFSRKFKQVYGITPTEYAKSIAI